MKATMHHKFEDYTLVVYQAPEEYATVATEERFTAFLSEFPEASLHEVGATQLEAVKALKKRFAEFVGELLEAGRKLPTPNRSEQDWYSGRIVLRMTPELHRQVSNAAHLVGTSLNSYIVSRLIRETTLDEVVERMIRKPERPSFEFTSAVVSEYQKAALVPPKFIESRQTCNVYDVQDYKKTA